MAGVNIHTHYGLGKMMFNFWKLQFKKEVKIVEWKQNIICTNLRLSENWFYYVYDTSCFFKRYKIYILGLKDLLNFVFKVILKLNFSNIQRIED